MASETQECLSSTRSALATSVQNPLDGFRGDESFGGRPVKIYL